MFSFRRIPPGNAAYRCDFYQAENIIGYTGNLGNNPTVYFHKDDEYGHITQAHGDASNVGREEVANLDAGCRYSIENVDGQAREMCQLPNGESLVLHPSRGTFVAADRGNIDMMALLFASVWRHTELKQMYHTIRDRRARRAARGGAAGDT